MILVLHESISGSVILPRVLRDSKLCETVFNGQEHQNIKDETVLVVDLYIMSVLYKPAVLLKFRNRGKSIVCLVLLCFLVCSQIIYQT